MTAVTERSLPLIVTRPHQPGRGSGLDPLVEEASWVGWKLTSASPACVSSEGAVQVAATFVDRIIESAWLPGRLSALTEVAVSFDGAAPRLSVILAFAVFGPAGVTVAEAGALSRLVEQRVHSWSLPYHATAIDPRTVLDVPADAAAHTALIRQRTVRIESDAPNGDVEVLSRFNPTAAPWSQVADAILTRRAPTRVRATVMPTEVSVADRMRIDKELAKANVLLQAHLDQADVRNSAERAVETLVDLGASLSTPALCVEIAVASSRPLEELFVRHVGSCFTSEMGVVRRRGYTVVAGQRVFLGGFDVERQSPGLGDALRLGLPLRGGVGARSLVDLITLTECPLGWPIPLGGPIPTIASGVLRLLPAPEAMQTGIPIGSSAGGARVHLPLAALERHAFVSGTTGTGKSTVLASCAVDDLRNGRPFLFVDWHGHGAERVVAFADVQDVAVGNIDADDGATAVLQLLPKLDGSGSNIVEVEQAAGRTVDSIVASLPKDWTGPRFVQIARALLVLTMVHGVEIADAVAFVDAVDELREKVKHPLFPKHYASVLLTLHSGSDAAATRDWVTSKFQPFLSALTRRVFGSAGRGVAIPELVAAGTPIILNLAGLNESDGKLVAHLVTSATFDAAMARPADARVPMRCYLDEAQKLAMASMQRIQTEGRKFGISLMCATQTMSQLDPVLADLAASAAVHIAFRQTPVSANSLVALFDVPSRDLLDLPDLHAYAKVSGSATCTLLVDPYELCPPLRVKRAPIDRALAGSPDPRSKVRAVRTVGSGSFLDEWLAKRDQTQVAAHDPTDDR